MKKIYLLFLFVMTVGFVMGQTITAPTDVVTTTSADGTGNCTTGIMAWADTADFGAVVGPIVISWNQVGGGNSGSTDTMHVADGVWPTGVSTVAWVVDTTGGTFITDTFTITVSDNEDPIFVGSPVPNVTMGTDAGNCTALGTSVHKRVAADWTDNCGVTGVAYVLTGATAGTVADPKTVLYNKGVTTVTTTATDAAANTDVIVFTVTVNDNEAPIISTTICNETFDLILDGTTGLATADTAAVRAATSDNCIATGSDAFDMQYTNSIDFSCSDIGTIHTIKVVVYDTATVPNPNAGVCEFFINPLDTTAPVAITKAITVYLDASGSVTIANDSVDDGSTDNCGIATYSTDITTFSCADVSASPIEVTLTVTDNYGKTDTETADVTVLDTVSPVVTCQNETIYLDTAGVATITQGQLIASIVEACSPLQDTSWTLTNEPSNTFAGCTFLGDTIVVITVEDSSGNEGTCSATITVADTIKPWVGCNDITAYLDASGNVNLTKAMLVDSVFDNTACLEVDTFWSINGNVSPASFAGCGLVNTDTIITINVTETLSGTIYLSGNTAMCDATVSIVDTLDPVVTCAADTTLYLDASGSASLVNADLVASVVENCTMKDTTLSQYAFDCTDIPLSPISITVTVTDHVDSTGTCTVNVTVADTIDPVLDVDPTLTVMLDSAGEYVVRFADLVINEASDNSTCPLDTSMFRIGETPVTTDTILTTCADILFHDDATPWEVGDSIVVSLSDGTNTVYDTVSLTVKDLIAPVLTTNNVVDLEFSNFAVNDTILLRSLVNDLASDWTGPGGLLTANTDNSSDCFDAEHTLEFNFVGDTMWTCANLGLDTLKVVANDIYGNKTDTTLVIVDVIDDIAPVIFAHDMANAFIDTVIVELDANGQFILTPAYVLANMVDSLSDNCCFDSTNVWAQVGPITGSPLEGAPISMFSSVVSQDTFDCDDLGEHRYYVTVKDCAGNIAGDMIYVKVEDNLAPTYAGSGFTLTLHDTIMSYVLTDWDMEQMFAGVVDNCGLEFTEFDTIYQKTFECLHVGVTNVMVKVSDVNDNVGTFTIPITVKDTTPPTVVTKDITVELGIGGAVIVNAGMVKESAWDLCGIDTMYLEEGEYLYMCGDTGVHTVHLSVVDIHNNKKTETATVTVVDNTNPTITAPDTVTVALPLGVCDSVVVIAVTAADNCSAVLTDDAPAAFPVGTTKVAYEAVDPSGNKAMDTVVVVVTAAPNAAPTVAAIADQVVGDTVASIEVAVVATDGGDCPAQTVTKTVTTAGDGVINTATCAGGTMTITLVSAATGTDTVTLTVSDGVADVTETFTVTVNAVNDAPTVVAPVADLTIYVGDALNVDVSGVFTDVDGDAVTVTPSGLAAWMDGTVAGVITGTPASADAGTTTITLTGSDPLGLEATSSFAVTVLDTSAAVGVIDIQDAFEVNMYPNPTRGIVTLDVQKAGLNKVDVSIFTVAGTEVFRQVYSTNLIKVNMANQVSGMYFVKMNIGGDQVIKKLILNRK